MLWRNPLREFLVKFPTGAEVLALKPQQLDAVLLSCIGERERVSNKDPTATKFLSPAELENIYTIDLNLPFAQRELVNQALMESCQRLLCAGFIMPAPGQPSGVMTVTAKGMKGLSPDPESIFAAMWVLECEASCKQGTAFTLENVGLVTCQHVLGLDTRAFKAVSPSEKLPVAVVASNAALDLAILNINGETHDALHRSDANVLQLHDDVTIAGFPNYRLGDSGTSIPGRVVGFRPVSGIRRILVSSSIVAGGSGGPAVNSTGEVIGVAATGADRMESAPETEHHSIIPINALDQLKQT
jgi:Trypsin-like peptidase domain